MYCFAVSGELRTVGTGASPPSKVDNHIYIMDG